MEFYENYKSQNKRKQLSNKCHKNIVKRNENPKYFLNGPNVLIKIPSDFVYFSINKKKRWLDDYNVSHGNDLICIEPNYLSPFSQFYANLKTLKRCDTNDLKDIESKTVFSNSNILINEKHYVKYFGNYQQRVNNKRKLIIKHQKKEDIKMFCKLQLKSQDKNF
ncbi:unnamed protein product [Brachionus calyciflorus]|uniref:Uncharacterized protein n=1 Tax=Brachionus calyciflorus TaxID=104777 RepID=A0A814HRM1_9BILA|nr:unnamed protein product [Brachionus calyciflorus]